MCRQSFWRAGVIGMSAISGIEQALWDIRGKTLKVNFSFNHFFVPTYAKGPIYDQTYQTGFNGTGTGGAVILGARRSARSGLEPLPEFSNPRKFTVRVRSGFVQPLQQCSPKNGLPPARSLSLSNGGIVSRPKLMRAQTGHHRKGSKLAVEKRADEEPPNSI